MLVGLPRVEGVVRWWRLVHCLDPQTLTHGRDHARRQAGFLPLDLARVNRQVRPHAHALLVLR
eukprot:4965198-Prymnesium_polylepis.1